jgi:hypothetical protein
MTAKLINEHEGDSPRNDRFLSNRAIGDCISVAAHIANGGEVTDEIRQLFKQILPACPLS